MSDKKTAELDLVTLSLAEIHPAKYNPRVDLQKDDDRYKSIERSLDHFGLVDPLVVNKKTRTLISGHQRFKILVDKGYTGASVSLVDVASDQEERALNLALNKVSGDWDYAMLAEALPALDEDMRRLAGFEEEEVARLVGKEDSGPARNLGEVTGRVGEFTGTKCPRCGFEFEEGQRDEE